MKIIWVVNTIFPYPAKKIGISKNCFGGWLNGLAAELEKEEQIELAICTLYNGKEIKKYNDGKTCYYLIPGKIEKLYDKKLESYWKYILDEFKPDLIHIHGTEFSHGLALKSVCKDVKVITSIQGLVSVYGKVYYANIDVRDILKNITIRDIIKRNSIFKQKKIFIKRGINEIKLIESSDIIVGRTMWDYSNTKAVNINEKFYIGNETLRKSFYNNEWSINNIERYSIFTSQASYPIKGLHFLLEAIYILKQTYPDIKLYIAGNNILDESTFINKVKMTGYAKYLKKLIKKYDLLDNVLFTGLLDEENMCKRYLKSNVFVLPSAIENSSNSLGEAMMLGMPCVASNTGGTMDILEHKKEGFLFPYTEPAMCAEYVRQIFENDDLAQKLGWEARKKAQIRHNPEKNKKEIIDIYNKVLEEKD